MDYAQLLAEHDKQKARADKAESLVQLAVDLITERANKYYQTSDDELYSIRDEIEDERHGVTENWRKLHRGE